MLENLYLWPWGQKSRSYGQRSHVGHECMQYILSYWYTHMLNMVCIRQRTKKLWPRHELTQTDGQTDRQTEYMIHRRMMIHPCAKYRMPMAKNKEFMARTQIHVKKLIFFISRSKVKVIQRSSIYMTHCLIVIHPYAKYGMPTSKNKEVMARTRICTDRRTDRQTTDKRRSE